MGWTLPKDASYTCPVKVRHRFTPGLEPPVVVPPLPRYALTAQATAQHLVDDFVSTKRDGVTLDLRAAPAAEAVARCLQAMAEGVPVIVGATLPPDLVGHRRGTAAILVRGTDSDTGASGYYPVEVHGRRVLDPTPSASVLISPFEAPCPFRRTRHGLHRRGTRGLRSTLDGWDFRLSRVRDRLDLAHLWHLLAATGHAAGGRRMGGLIGTEHPATISWAPLDDPCVPECSSLCSSTPSIGSASRTRAGAPVPIRGPRRTDGSRQTVMSRYATEFAFRLDMARAAQDEAGFHVEPIRTRECETCRWWPVCRPLLSEDDLSVRITKWPLDVHEITALRTLGISTVADLAAADLDELLRKYTAMVTHRQGIPKRLQAAARRARMLQAGVELERTTSGSIPVPSASLEIDLDIEASEDGRVYLWGFLIDDHAASETPYYKAFSSFEHLTERTEADLAVEALTWLADLVRQSDALIYHYSEYELVRLNQISVGDSRLSWAMEFARERFVDLFQIVRNNFFGVNGLGLKNVAQKGAGFTWRDPDPGGLNSQTWFEDAVTGPTKGRTAARERVLKYNEDDVRATWQLRQWLRTLS